MIFKGQIIAKKITEKGSTLVALWNFDTDRLPIIGFADEDIPESGVYDVRFGQKYTSIEYKYPLEKGDSR